MLKTKVLLILVLLLTATAGAWADGDVASRTTTGDTHEVINYESLAAAIAAAQDGETITMLADDNLGETGVTIDKDVTLDLNGFTLEYTGTSGTALTISANKSVIIQDNGTGENPGGIRCTAGGWVISNNGTLTINGGSFTATNALAISNDGTLTVNGGTISGTGGIKNNYPHKPKLTVTGGSITATGGNTWSVISISQDGTFNLSGNPTLTATYKATDIFLASGKVINIPADLTAPGTSPDNAWTVEINNDLPYTFTGNWPSTMSTADPALFFKSIAANVTTRFVDGTEGLKKAQFILPQATLTAAPTAKTGLEYTGGAQDLITAGTATGGTLYYGLGTSEAAPTQESAWNVNVPKEIEARTYYVWYKVVGDGSHTGIDPTGPLRVTIAKATPHIDTDPVAGDIMAGQTLENSILNGGSAMNPNTSQRVSGSFAWANPSTVPSISDSQSTEYDVTFTPSNTNYYTATTKITLKVNAPVVSRTNGTETHNYMTLEEALTAANDGETITLIGITPEKGCVELTSPVTIDKSVNLDLNGFMLFYEGTGDTPALTISSGKTVTIKDSRTDGSISTNSSTAIKNNGELLITGGSISATGANGFGIFNNGQLTISGSPTISATNTNGTGINHNGTAFNLSGNPTITGGDADISLADGKVINIDAALNALSTAWTVWSDNIAGAPATPYTFTSGWSDKMGTADPAAYFACTTAGITTCLTRGEAQFIIPKATITTAGENPTILNYATLADALADAADGDLITMLANETTTGGLMVNNSITLDLHGHTLTVGGESNIALMVSSGATVIIQDTGTGGTPGGINCTDMCAINNSGTLTIRGGGISTNQQSISNDGMLYVTGGTITGSDGIFNNGTMTVTGGTITGSDGIVNMYDNPVLNVSGGTITATASNGSAISIQTGTFNLSGNPTITGGHANISLADGKVINIDAALNALSTPWTVWSVNIYNTPATPYTFTSGWSDKMGTADPASYFACTTAGITTRLVDGATAGSNEAQFVKYTPLSDETTTKPTLSNGSSHTGDAVWIGDELTSTTTATPAEDITWQWYRKLGDADAVEIAGATSVGASTTYTVGPDDYDNQTQTGYQIYAVATMAAGAAGTIYPATPTSASSPMTPAVQKQDFSGTEVTEISATCTATVLTVTSPAQVENENTPSGFTYEYRLDGTDWSSNPQFTELQPASDYTVYARVAATKTMKESTGISSSTPFTTILSSINVEGYCFVGMELTGSHVPDMISDASYKWYRAATADATTWTEITSARGNSSYTLTDDEVGGYVKFEVIKSGHVIGECVYDANHAVRAAFDQKVTIDNVTYQISTPNDPRAVVAAIVGEGTGDHKTANIPAFIDKDDAQFADTYQWAAYGFTISNNVPVNDIDENLDLRGIGASADNYGYIQADAAAVYTALAGGTVQEAITVEGYKIYSLNNGYYALKNGEAGYDMVIKDKTVAESGMTAILNAAGMTGGSVTFYDKAGVALPAGTGDDADKFMAAAGQKVVVEVTLPTGYEFKSGTSNQQLTVTGSDENRIIQLTQVGTSNVWTAEFPMPSEDVTVSFKNTAPIQGKAIIVEIVHPTDGSCTFELVGSVPSTVHVLDELTFKLTPTAPTNAGDSGYELTSLGLNPAAGATATIKDATTDADVTLPYEGAVTVTLKIATDIEGTTLTFAPIFTKTYESVAFGLGKTTYCYDKGMKLRTANDNLKFYTVTSVSGTNVTLTEITSKTIPAYMPIIVENNTSAAGNFDMYVAVGEEANAAYAAACTTTGDAAVTNASEFQGTATDKTTAALDWGPWHMDGTKDYYGFNGTNFVWIKEAGAVAAHRCWLQIAKPASGGSGGAGARQLTLVWPDGETASLSEKVIVNSEEFATAEWYTLDGRKLQAKPQRKGVYIQNGQKVVIR